MRNLILAIFACLLLAGMTFSEGGKGQGQNNRNVMAAGTPSSSAWDKYEQAREKYTESLQNLKEKQKNTRETAFEKGKNYVSNAVSMLQRMLEASEEKISNSKRIGQDEKDVYLAGIRQREQELNSLSFSLNNATTARELLEQAKHVKQQWKGTQETAKLVMGGVGVHKLDATIEMGWKAAQKADELIDKCNQSGFDVSSADSHLTQFEEQLRLAEQENSLANQSFLNQTGNATTGYDHLRNAQQYLVGAKKISVELKNDLRTCVSKKGHVALAGSGWLNAQGSGQAEISGNGTVEANFTSNSSSGKVTIIDRAGDAAISVQGGNEVQDRNETSTMAKYVTMRTWTGASSVIVSGSRFTVILNGNEIQLHAEGRGVAVLRGSGNYTAGGDDNSTASRSGTWSGNGAAVKIEED